MRHPLALLAVVIVLLCSLLCMADKSSSSTSLDVLTLTSFTTIQPKPIIITSSEVCFPRWQEGCILSVTGALVIISTNYPPNESPVRGTSTEFRTFTYPGPIETTFPTVSTSTLSLPIPQTAVTSSTEDSKTGPLTSDFSSKTTTSKSDVMPVSSTTSSSTMTYATSPSTSTASNREDHKSTPIVVIIVPIIVGAVLTLAAIGLLIWWLRRRNLQKRNNDALPFIALPGGNMHDGQTSHINKGNRISFQRISLRKDRASFFDALGSTSKKLWPSWPFGEKTTLGTDSIKQAIMGAAVPVPLTPSRPVRSYEQELQYVTSPLPAELPGDSTLPHDKAPTVHRSKSLNGTSIAPSILPKFPDRDPKLSGKETTRYVCAEPEPRQVKKSLDESTQSYWSNNDGHISNQSSELHGEVLSPSTPATAWPSGSNRQLLAPSIPQTRNKLVTTPTKNWIEPPSSFSTPTNSTSPNTNSSGTQSTPNNWIEPISDAATGNRNRSYNAILPSPAEADVLRTVAERDNALAMLEGRGKVYGTASISDIYGEDKEHQFREETMSKAVKRSLARREEIRARFPFASAPVPGTVTDDSHDVSYTPTEGGSSIQRIDKNNGHGGWM
ncbi:f8abf357-2c01-45c6-b264-94ee67ab7084-CDS [Sclerotinia trifoliorum]|uniref:F8abf357-2c01-45c6-b264-94ee67ab7084-CDS n=1 Tax=Sclerotinia trifoliorum TaxID=28548 RepID=A0A8H2ZMV3_9HELO|nr:f8abf357-2c01-45c6-b264-94ee67ab7084-CDS [Sclerotinia trifoliorum]